MAKNDSLAVLITGCSSGIGRALALEFGKRGHRVLATARRKDTMEDLEKNGMDILQLDVTSDESIKEAVKESVRRAGGIDVLVNNAGFGLMGPIIELDVKDLRRQLDTNVVGPISLIKETVPHMIRRGGGRIVNVGSVSGVLTSPFSGAYCATKAALHALSDALRMELRPFGIRVITLQPGGVMSRFGDNASAQVRGAFDPKSLYAKVADVIEARARMGQEGAVDAETFARRAVDAILSPSPPAIFRMGVNSVKMPLIRWLLPTSVSDRFLSKRFSLDSLKKR